MRFHNGPCSVCFHRVPPENQRWITYATGDKYATTALIGERPGIEEHYKHVPFVGRTGEELDGYYLPILAGLNREDLWLSNVTRCFNDGRNPEDYEVEACASHHLPAELAQLPLLRNIVLMGGRACTLIPGLRLDLHHGIPREAELFGRVYKIFPMLHPAAGMHQPRAMREIQDDFRRLRRMLRGEWEELIPLNEHPRTDYRVWGARDSIPASTMLLALDTETKRKSRWAGCHCVTVSWAPGMARLIHGDDEEALRSLFEQIASLTQRGGKVVIHNATFDLDVLEHGFGVRIEQEDVIDTMVMAFGRGLPQSLKVLGYRLCGVEMSSYEDVVGPYVEDALYQWLSIAVPHMEGRAHWRAVGAVQALAYAVPNRLKSGKPGKMIELLQRDDVDADTMRFLRAVGMPLPLAEEGESGKMHRPMAPWKRVGRILADWGKSPSTSLLKRVRKMRESAPSVFAECEETAGGQPPDSIMMVDEEDLIDYACADADVDLRLLPRIREVRI